MAKIVDENALSAIASDIKNALSGKADSNDVYSKTEIDNALELKADKSDTYTKGEVDNEVYNVLPTDTASGAIAHFTDGADNIPVKSLVSQIVAVESGSGTKSPSNPYTISGFANGVVTRCGKNLLNNPDTTTTGGSYVINNVNVPMLAGYYVLSFEFSGTSNSSSLRIDDENGTAIFTTTKTITSGHNEYLINLPSKGSFVKLFSNAVGTYTNFQIEKGNQFTSFEAYNGNTYTFAFGQTVYGGHFDNKGNLVVTHSIVDLGTLNWVKDTNRTDLFRTPSLDRIKANGNTNYICDSYPVVNVSLSSLPDKSTRGYPSYGYIYMCDSTYHTAWENNTPDDFKTGVNGIYIVYELANPITLAITGQDIPTLLGENNIFSNCGDVEVDYHADIGLYIDKKISSLAQG